MHRRERKRKTTTTTTTVAKFDICRVETKAQTVVVVVEERVRESIVPT